MRSPAVGNPFRARLRFSLQRNRWGAMLVAGVQSVVSPFDEYFSPLNEAGRQETSHHTNDDLLSKRRVHCPLLGAEAVPLGTSDYLPKPPLAGLHDPEAEEEVGEGVGQDTRREAFGPIRDAIVERAGNEGGDPVRSVMGETEPDRDDRKRKPREGSDWDGVEFFTDQITLQEPAPEDFLHQRNDNSQSQETKGDRGPERGRLSEKNLGIEGIGTLRETEEGLR